MKTLRPLLRLPALAAFAFLATPLHALTLDSFDAGLTVGSVISGSTWEGNVTQNATSLTVGGLAGNDNGWAFSGGPINATGFDKLSFTAARNAGHSVDTVLVIQFEDAGSHVSTFTFNTADFALNTPTTLLVDLHWNAMFDYTNITSWSLGGGDPTALQDYRMTLSDFSLVATAVPEPATYGLLASAGLPVVAILRRRKKSPVA